MAISGSRSWSAQLPAPVPSRFGAEILLGPLFAQSILLAAGSIATPTGAKLVAPVVLRSLPEPLPTVEDPSTS